MTTFRSSEKNVLNSIKDMVKIQFVWLHLIQSTPMLNAWTLVSSNNDKSELNES